MSTKVAMQIFRHDFGEKFMEELEQFAIIHKYDDRKDFKDAWNKWTEKDSIRTQIIQEVDRLQNSGYKGDVLDKMFKSARYYFRKKDLGLLSSYYIDENDEQKRPRMPWEI